MCKNIIEGSVEGKRSRGRQRKTWMGDIKEWMEESSYGWVVEMTEDGGQARVHDVYVMTKV